MSDFFDGAYLEHEAYAIDAGVTAREAELIASFAGGPATRILDLGCGHGRHVAELTARGFKNVYGLDRSAACLAQAARAVPEAKRRLLELDVRELDSVKLEFDLAYAMYNSLFYWDDETTVRVFRSIRRRLHSGATFIVEYLDRRPVASRLRLANLPGVRSLRSAVKVARGILGRFGSRQQYTYASLHDGYLDQRRISWGGRRRFEHVVRCRVLTAAELAAQLASAGFDVLEDRPSLSTSQMRTIICRAA